MSTVESFGAPTNGNGNRYGSYVPVGDGEEIDVHYFSLKRQPVDTLDPRTGEVKKSASDGAMQNFTVIKPGIFIVAEMNMGRKFKNLGRREQGVVMVPQERFAATVALGRAVSYLELPGGGIDPEDEAEAMADMIKNAAERELREEAGVTADDFIPIGDMERGLFAHPYSTGHNFTVYAPGARFLDEGSSIEDTEVIEPPRVVSWQDTEDMIIHSGVHSSGEISSSNVIAALYQTRLHKERAQSSRPKVLDLGQFRN